MRGALVLGVLAGCYNPSLQDCAITCVNNACPSGFECVANVCRSTTGACPGGGSADAPVITGFAFRKMISLSNVPGGFATNFPLSIRRAMDPDLANFAQVGGADIQFTTIDGMVLPSQIERFDKAKGELVAWVNVPEITASTQLFMYFGNATANAPPATAVWDANYLGVWHLSDPPGTSVADSTVNAIAAQKAGPPAPLPSFLGKFAGGHVFSGAPMEYLTIGNSVAVSPLELTFETWINYTIDATDSYPALFATSNQNPQHPCLFYVNNGTQAAAPKESLAVQLGGQAYFTPAGTFAAGVWNHVVLSTAGTAASTALFINGAKQPLMLSGLLFPTGIAVTFGGLNPTSVAVNALVDEIRYSKALRPDGYAIASYYYGSQDSLVTFGPVETVR
jgi:hypothetical protein